MINFVEQNVKIELKLNMNRFIKIFPVLIVAIFIVAISYSQDTISINSVEYKKAKANGTLSDYVVVLPEQEPIRPTVSSQLRTQSSCYGYFPPSPNATQASFGGLTDDGSTAQIPFPFNFCFYGNTYTSFYLNINGNITFDAASGTYSSTGFPVFLSPEGGVMIAPFWADVDLGGIGNIYYEVLPNAVIVHWVNVGYYASHTDKKNTFMLIFTDGTSPLLSPGNNIGLFYDDMQWTTGDASNGTNGFGGTPATVGLNKNDGTTYIQLGRFNQAGVAYDGAYGSPDGVDWLDNKYFMFDACNSTNVSPIVNGIEYCDTLKVCVGDSLPIVFDALSGESGQVASIFFDTSLTHFTNFHFIDTTIANTASFSGYYLPDASNVGLDSIYFEVHDNGTPADTISFYLLIQVDSMPFYPAITGDTITCLGTTVPLTANSGFDTYTWSNGGSTTSTNVPPGQYDLTVTYNGCSAVANYYVASYPDYTPTVGGDTIVCLPASNLIGIDTTGMGTLFTSISWSNGATTDSIYVQDGTYTVTVVDTNTCSFSDAITLTPFSVSAQILGNTSFCENLSTNLYVSSSFDSYSWNTGSTNDTIIVSQQGIYWCDITQGTCTARDSVTVVQITVVNPVISGNQTYCPGNNVTLSVNNGGYSSINWQPTNQTTQQITVTAGNYQVFVTFNGCQDSSTIFTVSELPVDYVNVQFDGPLEICQTDTLGAVVSNSFSSYSWSNGDNTPNTQIVSGGNFNVAVVDANGCTTDTSFNVILHNLASVISNQSACNYEFDYIGNTASGAVYWSSSEPGISFNDPSLLNPIVYATQPGTYTLSMYDSVCNRSSSSTIEFIGDPFIDLMDDTICKGYSYSLDATQSLDSISYSWLQYPSSTVISTNPILYVDSTQSKTYVVLLSGVCSNYMDTVSITVENCEIPNVITPFSTIGQNDGFEFNIARIYSDVELIIYNRWGRIVYSMSNYSNSNPWKGTNNNGKALDTGTYYYIITYDNAQKQKSGFVQILDEN